MNPTGGLDDVVHQRHRLGILTIAVESDRVEFTFLRDILELTAGNLNRHLAVLESAGLIATEKALEGRRPRTWVRVTRKGRVALSRELSALERLVRRHQQLGDASPGDAVAD
jgi:DNA-binding MarR family transcriptional regulator